VSDKSESESSRLYRRIVSVSLFVTSRVLPWLLLLSRSQGRLAIATVTGWLGSCHLHVSFRVAVANILMLLMSLLLFQRFTGISSWFILNAVL
jgi:hypothetical protein